MSRIPQRGTASSTKITRQETTRRVTDGSTTLETSTTVETGQPPIARPPGGIPRYGAGSGLPMPQSGIARPSTTSGLPRRAGAQGIPRPSSGIPQAGMSRLPAPASSQTGLPRYSGQPRGAISRKTTEQTTIETPSKRQTIQRSNVLGPPVEATAGTGGRVVDKKETSKVVRTADGRMQRTTQKSMTKTGLAPPKQLTDEMIQEKAEKELDQQVERELLETASKMPGKSLLATVTKRSMIRPPQVQTNAGPVPAVSEVSMSRSLIRAPNQPDIVSNKLIGVETVGPGKAIRTELEVAKLLPKTAGKSKIGGKEVVTTTTSIATTGKIKQVSKTVTYDAPKTQHGAGGRSAGNAPLPSAAELSRLVAEENADIEKTKPLLMPDLEASRPETYGIRKNVEQQQLSPQNISLLVQAIPEKPANADETQEEPNPELIASILNTEERGLAMGSAPGDVYNYLFAESKGETVINVSSVTKAPLQDIVVPERLPDQVKENVNSADVLRASKKVEKKKTDPIPENLYVETVGKEPVKSRNTAKKVKRKKVPIIAKELPPWGIHDVEPIVDVVGAQPAEEFLDEEQLEEANPVEDGIEYLLHIEAPMHNSQVQLRGSNKPSWFPGYLLALPELPEVVKIVQSPSLVFSAAWRATQPDIFADESLFIN